eukprot:g709.t1
MLSRTPMMLGEAAPPIIEISVLRAVTEGGGSVAQLKAALKRTPGDVDMLGTSRITPLMPAAQNGRADLVELLLEAGADPLKRDASGLAALHFAVERDRVLCTSLLLRGGADADAQDNAGESALHRAAEHGWTESTTLLLDAGANPNLKDSQGETPLAYALDWHEWQSEDMKRRKKQCAEMLESRGAMRPPPHHLPPVE